MKKILTAVLLSAGLLMAGVSQGQTKIGYVRIDDIVSVMPELAPEKVNLDTVGQQYVRDSIMPGLNYKQEQYTQKLKDYADTTKSKQVRDLIARELQDLQEQLNGADNFIQQVLQAKQQEYLRPYYTKAKTAIETVAKKKGYTHILSTDIFLVAPEADDISYAVLDELKIKLPQQNNPASKPGAKTGN